MGNLSNYYSEPVTHTFVTLDMPEAALITLSLSPAIAED